MKKVLTIGFAIVGMSATAGGWNLSAGPAWRSRVKSEISGSVPVATVSPSHTVSSSLDVENHGNWNVGEVTQVPDPDPFAAPGDTLYAVESVRTETTVVPGATSARLDSSDDNSPLGLRVNGGYDWDIGERFAIGVNVLFAGYWKMESSARGSAAGGTQSVSQWRDTYLFDDGPYPDDTYFGSKQPHFYNSDYLGTANSTFASRSVSARIRSDLYQIGLGPKATWHALSWLDAYAGVNALCNIANMDLSTSSGDASEVKCRFGVGADVGLAAYLTDWLGLYADVGYEWVDKANVSSGNVSADVDFSSLVVSAGAIVRF